LEKKIDAEGNTFAEAEKECNGLIFSLTRIDSPELEFEKGRNTNLFEIVEK